jgi:hypothetical protein
MELGVAHLVYDESKGPLSGAFGACFPNCFVFPSLGTMLWTLGRRHHYSTPPNFRTALANPSMPLSCQSGPSPIDAHSARPKLLLVATLSTEDFTALRIMACIGRYAAQLRISNRNKWLVSDGRRLTNSRGAAIGFDKFTTLLLLVLPLLVAA